MILATAQSLSVAGVTIPTMGGGDNTWFQIGQWVLGGIVLLLVLLLGYGAFLFVKGKVARSNGEKKANGVFIVGGSVLGAVVLGSATAAVAWSGSNGTQLAGLLPSDAAPGQTVAAERQAPLVSCDEPASIEADNRDNTVTMHPEHAEHDELVELLEHNGVLDDLKQALVDEGSVLDSRDELDENWRDEIRIGGVTWQPADAAEGCDSSQWDARAGSTMHVDVWFDSGWVSEYYNTAGYVDREVTVGD